MNQSLRALLVQIAALLAVLLLGRLVSLSGWPLIVGQGLLAAALSRLIGQPRWWWPIHLLFFPLLVLFTLLDLSPWLWFGIFLLLALLFWGVAAGDVPLFLSSQQVAAALAELAAQNKAKSFVELGAGVGSVVVPLARLAPDLAIEAWERAPLPWLLLRLRCRRLPNVTVRRLDLWQGDLAPFDLAYAFLSPLPMPRLAEKAQTEMRPDSLLVSSSFPIPERIADETQQLADRRKTVLYSYRIAR